MAKAGYSIVTGGAVALSAATAKTILGVKATSGFGIDLQYVEVGFDGVTAGATPVLVEIQYCTWASNSPGTNSTSVTPAQIYGRAVTVGATAAKTWTTEPTAITTFDEELLTPYGGLVKYDWPLGRTPDSNVSEGFTIRCTAPAAVNVRATMIFERI
jgi:hypothetical protein